MALWGNWSDPAASNTAAERHVGSSPTRATKLLTMSKGKKYKTPRKYWGKTQHDRGWTAHVMGSKHKKFKWFYRCKKWFKDDFLQKMSMRFPTAHEIWGWD